MESSMEIPQKLTYDPVIPLLNLKEYVPGYNRLTCTPIFIAVLFIIAKVWKQPRCPTADEWIKKMCYIYA
jgi:hypothetical protein